MTKDEALKLALEALDNLAAWTDGEVGGHMDEPYSAEVARRTITAIKEALEQPEQAPMHYYRADAEGNLERIDIHSAQPEQEPMAWHTEPFKPDWDTQAVLVEEQQRMAQRICELEALLESQTALLERQTARIVDLQTHIANLEGEE